MKRFIAVVLVLLWCKTAIAQITHIVVRPDVIFTVVQEDHDFSLLRILHRKHSQVSTHQIWAPYHGPFSSHPTIWTVTDTSVLITEVRTTPDKRYGLPYTFEHIIPADTLLPSSQYNNPSLVRYNRYLYTQPLEKVMFEIVEFGPRNRKPGLFYFDVMRPQNGYVTLATLDVNTQTLKIWRKELEQFDREKSIEPWAVYKKMDSWQSTTLNAVPIDTSFRIFERSGQLHLITETGKLYRIEQDTLVECPQKYTGGVVLVDDLRLRTTWLVSYPSIRRRWRN